MNAAVIWYCIDQNCPSYPFLIELNCAENASKEQVEEAVREWFIAQIQDDLEDLKNDGEEAHIEIKWASEYGDLTISLNTDEQIVFVGLPEKARVAFGLLPPV